MSEFSLQKQIDCVAREIKMREYVYPTRVTARKMSVDKSVHELGAMRAVLATLIGLQATQSPPCHRCGRTAEQKFECTDERCMLEVDLVDMAKR